MVRATLVNNIHEKMFQGRCVEINNNVNARDTKGHQHFHFTAHKTPITVPYIVSRSSVEYTTY